MENIARLTSLAIKIPIEEFIDRCKTYYTNKELHDISIYRSEDLQRIIYTSLSPLTIFVKQTPTPIPEPIRINFVDL